MTTNNISRLELSEEPMGPSKKLRLLFIHHSCGGQLLATAGIDSGTNCLYSTHPNGGGLRTRLENNAYEVHEASYRSKIGEHTDIFDWPSKFQTQMTLILTCKSQDAVYQSGIRNEIVVFKSCFPNNQFAAAGTAPGNSSGPELTVWNAKAAYKALLEEFGKYPGVLFVCVTAPPLAGRSTPQPIWRQAADRLLGRNRPTPQSSHLARQFNHWLGATDGWLEAYPFKNVVVFDFYDILTGQGQSDFSAYPSGNGYDSHPNREGNERAAEAFLSFLHRAVHRWQEGKAAHR